jgi:hypothetical protein
VHIPLQALVVVIVPFFLQEENSAEQYHYLGATGIKQLYRNADALQKYDR